MVNNIYQEIRISCKSSWTTEQDADGNTLRNWEVSLVAIDDGKQVPGKLQAMLDHVEYILHPTFPNPRRDISDEPYLLKESGWGEFDLRIMLHFADEFAPREIIVFDLNFKEPHYSKTHLVTFSDVSAEVASYLESLKDIAKESSHQKSKKKLPQNNHHYNNGNMNDQHNSNGYNYYSDDELSLPATSSSSLSPAPPALSPPSDLLTPQQDFDEISPLSEGQHYVGLMDNDVQRVTNGNRSRQDENDNNNDDDDPQIEDEVLNENDIDNLNPIHYEQHDSSTCEAWNIPERFNMVELARRLSLLSESQAETLTTMIRKYQNNTMSVDQKDGEMTLDLYSLGAPLLGQIWAFTDSLFGNDMDDG
ncbi:yeats family-domain-containing protein [Halteromyces radiatus]|uniref:yeats family-domain-containing protein n=1 Tax=Halteromyces radiatus TaxID=101107 RepID=UPI00222017C5|nr:yeats family-domain-containing protein [Halteromyces radiatus]KAI8084755.1 yeats family-domain-containing protein [Halteromyces radiatus]